MYRLVLYFKQEDCERIARVNRAARKQPVVENRLKLRTPDIGQTQAFLTPPSANRSKDPIEDLNSDVGSGENILQNRFSFVDISHNNLHYGISSLEIKNYYFD